MTLPLSQVSPGATKAPTGGATKAPTGGATKAPTGGATKAPTGGATSLYSTGAEPTKLVHPYYTSSIIKVSPTKNPTLDGKPTHHPIHVSVSTQNYTAPQYMLTSPEWWIYPTRESCCANRMQAYYDECLENGGVPNVSINAPSLWYPDWSGADEGCLNNNQAPAYMTANPTTWMFNDQSSCCKKYYPWSLEKCMSIASVSPTTSAVSALIGSFFPGWETDAPPHTCVSTQNYTAPQYMLTSPEWWIYPTRESCCANRMQAYYDECLENGGIPNVSINAPSLWYPDWSGADEGCARIYDG
ncbi:predicted protein [Thalassiosira pseudonana CCMP1335]|uniref:Uncharacterized protein n=1 Tax=Thalassiosira pseudonana TaxID=35128 RepID=B8C4U2_THAPS|nr:predicted protein [Thalassiosira pseudonana CCMP1335]EED91385.1 predicted protein [Thalassiosira pseudonana CCMP1335]